MIEYKGMNDFFQVPTLPEWLLHEFQSDKKITRIGADPALIPADTWENWQRDLGKLMSLKINLIIIARRV